MDIHYELNGLKFLWNAEKAKINISKHDGISFEQAATVFFDPFFRLVDASRNNEARDAVLGYDNLGRLLFVVHIEYDGDAIVIISARKATPEEVKTMIPDSIKIRLTKDREMTSITLRIPVDVVESMKAIAPQRGFSGYQPLLKSYIGEGLRRDEAQYAFSIEARLIAALKKRGVSSEVLEDAARELHAA